MTAPIPANEAQRLDALRRYEILDTAPEQVFDDITLLASQICQTPIALISLVDADRQWFKSRRGLTESETSRNVAFCAHGILEPELFMVEDASVDPRFAANPLVTSRPHIRFYAGAPLRTPDGYSVGMLCVNDQRPRSLLPPQQEALKALARQAVSQFELRWHVKSLSDSLTQQLQSETALRQAEARLRDIFDNAAEGIFQTTPSGRLLTANPAMALMLGYQGTDEFLARIVDVGRGLYATPSRRGEFKRLLERHGSVRGFEAEFVRKDGQTISVSMSARAVLAPDGSIAYYEGIVRDVTELKRAGQALQQAHDRLETRVAERTAELQSVNLALSKEVESRKVAQAQTEALHRQLEEASRQAGKAEMATGILHNVGNVISNINVSSSILLDKVRSSKVAGLSKAVALMREHLHDLGTFLTAHPQGKQLFKFLSCLAEHLTQSERAVLEELHSMRSSIEHLKEVITLQQGWAKQAGGRGVFKLTELVEDALRLNAATLESHQIEVKHEYASAASVLVEKHAVLQILVNIIRNVQHAVSANHSSNRHLIVRTADRADGCVSISVTDNGMGISPENQERLFQHGFTTRPDGHGFGLHSAAIAARELGGSLTAASAGVGQGATFTLDLPATRERRVS
ncbi:MAG: PAS domain S-box protein [Verrucomicrobiota bacterium]